MKNIFKLSLIILALSEITACSATLSTLPVPKPNLKQKRTDAYMQSANVSVLKAPPGISLPNPDRYYLITNATTKGQEGQLMTLPPGSQVSKRVENLPVTIALEKETPAKYSIELKTLLSSPQIEVNQTYQDTWYALLLSLQAAGYDVSESNIHKGNIVLRQGPNLPQMLVPNYQLHVAIKGQWRRKITAITMQLVNGGQANKTTAKATLTRVAKSMKNVTKVPHDESKPATVIQTVNSELAPIMLTDRSASWTWKKVGVALKQAGYKIVKQDQKGSAYFFIDTVSSKGVVSKNMPLYILYVRSNGAISKTILIDEKRNFVQEPLAGKMFANIQKNI